MKIYEACVGNYKEALLAFEKGADRIELCDNLMEDGTTPRDRILTKGGTGNAISNKDFLKELVDYADGRIVIMPGKGVNIENRELILEYIGANEIHGSKVV